MATMAAEGSEAAYTLYYWPIAFRGNFAKTVLNYRGLAFRLAPVPELLALKKQQPEECPAVFMAPPLLRDEGDDLYINQMPAIMMHLASKLDLLPKDRVKQSVALKMVLDSNDVLAEITRNNGSKMWDREAWSEWAKDEAGGRFVKWLQIFEVAGKRSGLGPTSGWVLGTEEPTVADLTCFALFANMEHCLPELSPFLRKWAPSIMAACDRLKAQSQGLADMMAAQPQSPYCGGQIEASIRSMLA